MTNYVYYHLIQKIFCKNKYTPCEEDEKILENMNENKTCLNFNIQQLISEFFLS